MIQVYERMAAALNVHMQGALQNACGKKRNFGMGKSALREITSTEFMSNVWRDFVARTPRIKRDSYGSDGVSINDVEKNRKPYLSTLGTSIRNGDYTPKLLVPHLIPKTNNKERVICIPTVGDRLVQRCVLEYLNAKGYTLNNDISFGFIKGKAGAVKQAGVKACIYRNKYKWAYKADISSFFDEIDRDLIKEKVCKKVKSRSLRAIICKFIDCELNYESEGVRKRVERVGIQNGQGLRQGMPLSPYLANLYLWDFDTKIIRKGLKVVRYADDLIAFGNTRKKCEEIHQICTELLLDVGLKIHDIDEKSKTVIAEPEEMIEFLGLGLALHGKNEYKLIVTPQQIGQIKSHLNEYKKLDYCAKKM